MKKVTFAFIACFIVSIIYSQEKPDKITLGLISSHPENFEYVTGKVKEIHYRPYHVIEENGVFKKGEPWKLSESENTELRQPWSYYFNEKGELNKMSIIDDNEGKWIGIAHLEDGKIENMYWLKDDTLMFNWDYLYPTKNQFERHWKMTQDNRITGKLIYHLDNSGNVLKVIGKNASEEMTYTAEYARNSDGTIKTENSKNKDGEIMWGRDNYTYYPNGLLKNYHHNIFRGEKADQQGVDAEYKYDDKGNWIERRQGNWLLIERTFKYYE